MTDGIPAALPALALAAKLQRKSLSVPGLDLPAFETERRWASAALSRLVPPVEAADPGRPAPGEAARQVGALLWAIADLGRQLDVDPEDSLRATALRFRTHVREVERARPEPG